jgi:hypothetical protein
MQRQSTTAASRIEDEYQAIFDSAIDDAMRYGSDARHSYNGAMGAYITHHQDASAAGRNPYPEELESSSSRAALGEMESS